MAKISHSPEATAVITPLSTTATLSSLDIQTRLFGTEFSGVIVAVSVNWFSMLIVILVRLITILSVSRASSIMVLKDFQ